MLDKINRRSEEAHMITIEDPIEFLTITRSAW